MENGIVLNEMVSGDHQQNTGSSGLKPVKSDQTTSAAHLVSSLDILQPDCATSDTLRDIMERNMHGLFFLKNSGNYWPESKLLRRNSVCALWFVVCRVILFAMFLLMIVYLFSNAFNRSAYTAMYIATDVAMGLDLVAVLIAQYLNQQRLSMPAQRHDAMLIEESVRISTYFMYASLVTVMVSSIVYLSGQMQSGAFVISNVLLLVLGAVCVSINMAFNLFFLIMDLKVSALLLDQLMVLADKRVLTMKVFNSARNDILRRNNNSRWASDFIAGPCVASVIAIAIVAFNLNQGEWAMGIAWAIALTKELIFICVAFWYVAKVNGKADALTLQLSADTWLFDSEGTESATHKLSANDDVEAVVRGVNVISDMQRLSVYASSLAQPISFTLLFKRVSWENVVVSALGFAVTIVVGLVKSSIEGAAG